MQRRRARVISIGSVKIGGSHPIAIQSMAKTTTADSEATVRQIHALTRAGCEIVRVAVKDLADAAALRVIKRQIKIPLVADIHFDWRLAIAAIESGVDKIRLNPGNIYRQQEVARVVAALKSAKIPLRVGMNSGSLRPSRNARQGMAARLVAGGMEYIRTIEKMKFHDIVISLKASTVADTVQAYRMIATRCAYPLHLGVTATGSPQQGAIKSAIACGMLLAEGIGDTLRVSLTADPVQEVVAAKAILEAVGQRSFGPQVISCPTCGRCEVDLVSIVKELETALASLRVNGLSGSTHKPANPQTRKPIKVAVMGCVVNGPGEAREADIGIAFGKGRGMLFKKGRPVKTVPAQGCVELLIKELKKAMRE